MSQQLTSPFAIRQLAEYVAGRIGRPLKLDELSWLRNFVEEHVPQQTYLSNIQLAQSIRKIGNAVARMIATHSQQREVPDVHQMLVDIMRYDDGPAGTHYEFDTDGDESFFDNPRLAAEFQRTLHAADVDAVFGVSDIYNFAQWVHPYAVYGTRHLLLDSSERTNPGDMSVFRWDLNPVAAQTTQAAKFAGPLRNIVAARISPFWAPGLSEAALPPAQTTIFQFYVGIDEFAEQAYLDLENANFQFIMNAPPAIYAADEIIKMSPLQNNRGLFVPDKPVTTLNSVTLRIYSNNIPVPLAPEFLIGNLVILGGVASVVIPSIVAGSPYPLAIGQALVISNLPESAILSLGQELYEEITDPDGVTILNDVPFGQYEIDVDATAAPDQTIEDINVLVPRRVLHIALTLVYRLPEDTNDLQ